MRGFLRRFLRRPSIEEIPLIFRIDRNEQDQHVVRTYMCVAGEEIPVENIDEIRRVGYRREVETDDGTVIYVVREEDRQRLQALHSLRTRPSVDGTYIFDFVPRILTFLREAEHVDETPASCRLKVSDRPIKPVVVIHYDRQIGLDLDTGLRFPDNDDITPKNELSYTSDNDYIIRNDVFYLAPHLELRQLSDVVDEKASHVDLEDIPKFFVRDLVLIKKQFEAVLVDGAEDIRVHTGTLKPIIYVDKTVPGWLDFNVDYSVGEITISHAQIKLHDGETYLQANETTWIKVPWRQVDEVQKKLDDLEAEPVNNGYRIPVTEFASLEDFIDSIGGFSELGKAYQQFINDLTNFQADYAYHLSLSAENDLERCGIAVRPYQRAGIHWLHWLQLNQLHGMLADDMGLGKTMQAILAMRIAYERANAQQHSLVVAPVSVLPHWEREIRHFFSEIRVLKYHGIGRYTRAFFTKKPTIFITSYGIMANDIYDIAKIPFLYVVLDESTHIKNSNTKRAQAAKQLNASHRLALSGTPVENRPAELWSVFDFLMRGHLGKFGTFSSAFEKQILSGDYSAAQRLGRRIRPFILRRMKEDVAKDLPEKIEMNEWCQMSDEQQGLYASLNDATKNLRASIIAGHKVNYTMHILPLITKLKQICDHPAIVTGEMHPILGRSNKFDWIIERITQILENNEQVVIFSHFLGMLDLLEKVLIQKDVSYMRIDGATRNRQQLIDHFNEGKSRVALLSIRAAGYGINLTSANHVIHADRWWNPAVENQATDRVHRIGQHKTVYVYRILVEGTLEERIDALLAAKQDIANSIVRAATEGSLKWTREELVDILQPLPE